MSPASGSARQPQSDQTIFLDTWATYRKVLTSNYMFHREVYSLVRKILTDEIARPFSFLDVACGDALATTDALKGTPISSYFGIDISEPALALARDTLSALGCPVVLQNRDFVEALADWREPVDVVWIGQSLHHLETKGKLDLMRSVRRIVPEDGIFLIWEPTLLDGENSAGWMARFDALRPDWWSLTDDQWNSMRDHSATADHQETERQWLGLGRAARFCLYRDAVRLTKWTCSGLCLSALANEKIDLDRRPCRAGPQGRRRPGLTPGTELHTDADYDGWVDRMIRTHPAPTAPTRLFAYGSLIWKPEIEHVGEQLGIARGWHRAFCLRMTRFRGTPEQPGLMMALDRGGQCRGVLYDLPNDNLEGQFGKLFRREFTYKPINSMPRWITVETASGPTPALTFVMNRVSPVLCRSPVAGCGRRCPGQVMWSLGHRGRVPAQHSFSPRSQGHTRQQPLAASAPCGRADRAKLDGAGNPMRLAVPPVGKPQ